MSLSSQIKDLWENAEVVISRPAEVYTVGVATYALFNIIRPGAIYITALGAVVTAAPTGATEIRLTANGVNVDAAAVAIDGAVGTIVLSSLNVAGTLINAAAAPETVATQSRMFVGTQAAAVGVIQAVFSVGTDWTGILFMVFHRLTKDTVVVIA